MGHVRSRVEVLDPSGDRAHPSRQPPGAGRRRRAGAERDPARPAARRRAPPSGRDGPAATRRWSSACWARRRPPAHATPARPARTRHRLQRLRDLHPHLSRPRAPTRHPARTCCKGIAITNALPTVSSALPVVVPADVPLPWRRSRPTASAASTAASPTTSTSASAKAALPDGAWRPRSAEETGKRAARARASALASASSAPCASPPTTSSAPCSWPRTAGPPAATPSSPSAPAARRAWPASLVLSNAERLACLTLMWLWRAAGGYRKGFVEDPCMIEPHTLATSFAHPNLTTMAIATGQLSRYYGLGHGGGGLALSDAKLIDYQDGFERGMGAAFCILAGGGIGNSGIVGPDEAISLEQLVHRRRQPGAGQLDPPGHRGDRRVAGPRRHQARWASAAPTSTRSTPCATCAASTGSRPLFPRPTWSRLGARPAATRLMERAHREVERILATGYPPPRLLPGRRARRAGRHRG